MLVLSNEILADTRSGSTQGFRQPHQYQTSSFSLHLLPVFLGILPSPLGFPPDYKAAAPAPNFTLSFHQALKSESSLYPRIPGKSSLTTHSLNLATVAPIGS